MGLLIMLCSGGALSLPAGGEVALPVILEALVLPIEKQQIPHTAFFEVSKWLSQCLKNRYKPLKSFADASS